VLFFEAIIQKEQVMHLLATEKDTVLVPISLHTKKLRQRGYNHAKLLADQIGKRLSLPIVDCLLRSKETKIQAGLTKKEREANMKDAFSVKSVDIKNKTIFLVDDIVTTGVTFGEAAKVLKKNGAKAVYGLAFSGEN
jgi:competence protein ComFC